MVNGKQRLRDGLENMGQSMGKSSKASAGHSIMVS